VPVAPHKCLVCRAPVHGAVDGAAFGVMGKFLFTTCHAHAPLARMAGKTMTEVAAASASALIERKAPLLGHIFRELRAARQKEIKS
jgi:hypothetical protein